MAGTDANEVREFVANLVRENPDPMLLLQQLIRIQEQYAHIPQAAIESLQQLSHSTEIESVIEFYRFLSRDPQIQYQLLLSDNITDRFAGNQQLYQQMQSALQDQPVAIEFTSCTGLCDQGPGLLVNGRAINQLDASRVDQIAQLIRAEKAVSDWPSELFAIEDNIQHRGPQLDASLPAGAAIQRVLELGAEASLQLLDDSGLRGRGGAGFSTAAKWRFCLQAEADTRYVVCNADEGEPGTFKDRVLMQRHAHEVFEGMTACAAVIGASKGLLYLRGEYRYLVDHLNAVLQQRREQGLLGEDIQGRDGFTFDIDIHLGAGAYICGEESALIESLEGKRGIPRIRPPFPVESGYKNLPTVVNNVETFWSVSHILQQGSDWFRQVGTEQSAGTRLLSISGDCTRPGIYEFAFGTSVQDILTACGGADAQAIQMAGAAGNLVLARDFSRCMSYEDLATGGSFMVIGPERNLLEILDNFAQFFRHESCGFCTPCRVGTSLIADLMQHFLQGRASHQDKAQLAEIAGLLRRTSFCGLGTTAATAMTDALQNCPQIFDAAIDAADQDPVFDLEQAVSDFRQLTQTTPGAS